MIDYLTLHPPKQSSSKLEGFQAKQITQDLVYHPEIFHTLQQHLTTYYLVSEFKHILRVFFHNLTNSHTIINNNW